MIELKQIESFYPEHLRVFKKSILREYLQYKILEIIYDSQWAQNLIFIGGTAIRIIHAQNRFSEDLDFDHFGLTKDDFKRLVDQIKRRLLLEGYQIEVKITDQGAWRAYLRILNVLFENDLTGHKHARLLIQVDTEAQKVSYQPQKVILNKFDVFLHINTVPIDTLLSQKIYCLFNRKRPKGRDFYDVVFLLSKTKPNMEYLRVKLAIDTPIELKQKILSLCDKLNFKELSQDVLPFLIDPKEHKRILLFRGYIQGVDF